MILRQSFNDAQLHPGVSRRERNEQLSRLAARDRRDDANPKLALPAGTIECSIPKEGLRVRQNRKTLAKDAASSNRGFNAFAAPLEDADPQCIFKTSDAATDDGGPNTES